MMKNEYKFMLVTAVIQLLSNCMAVWNLYQAIPK